MVKQHLMGKFGRPCLNVPGCCRTVAGKDVSPVSLAVDQQVFLAKLNKRITDGCIPVRMVFHRMADDVGHLVVTAVVKLLHGMKNPPLNRFQSVGNLRHRPFQDHIRRIIQEPALVHL